MVGGETINQKAGKFRFPIHKNPVPGNKNIFKGNDRLAADPSENGVSGINSFLVIFAVVIGLTAENHRNPRRIGRNGADQSIIL